ncbi:MAG TPA: DedA family protein [archaeon]|nr:DedA family protein [archaeon]
MVLSEILTPIITYLTGLIDINIYLGVLAATFLETVFPPIPSEIIMPLAGYLALFAGFGYLRLLIVILAATIGSTLGATVIYYLSLKAGRGFILKYGKYMMINKSKVDMAERWFKHYGGLAVFLGRMAPGVRELISVPAGLAKMRIDKFLLYTFAGSFVWSAFLVSIGYFIGQTWQSIVVEKVVSILGIVILLAVASYVIFRWFMRQQIATSILSKS